MKTKRKVTCEGIFRLIRSEVGNTQKMLYGEVVQHRYWIIFREHRLQVCWMESKSTYSILYYFNS